MKRPLSFLKESVPVASHTFCRLREEFSEYMTIQVAKPKVVIGDASLTRDERALDEIEVDKTLCFIEEPAKHSECEVMRLKYSRMVIVKVRFWLEASHFKTSGKLSTITFRLSKGHWIELKLGFEFAYASGGQSILCSVPIGWVVMPTHYIFVVSKLEHIYPAEHQEVELAEVARDDPEPRLDAEFNPPSFMFKILYECFG
ncbi:hypothetical protein Tco_1112503 [Tanacetum coccineum]|uniref:Uncharacterized protein n=1 Tax=Tanacetum coccineum TaxID=301880 RepID=A0ABQ5IR17_9ASTR